MSLNDIIQTLHEELLQKYPDRKSILLQIGGDLLQVFLLLGINQSINMRTDVISHNVQNYFAFVFLGEMALRPFLNMLTNMFKEFKQWINSGIAELYFSKEKTLSKALFFKISSSFLFDLLYISLISSIMLILFHLMSLQLLAPLSWYKIWLAIFFWPAFFPFFFLLGGVGLLLLTTLKRGEALFYRGISLLSLVSDIYFPLNVFSSTLIKNILLFSPFVVTVKAGRWFYSEAIWNRQNLIENLLQCGIYYFFFFFLPLLFLPFLPHSIRYGLQNRKNSLTP